MQMQRMSSGMHQRHRYADLISCSTKLKLLVFFSSQRQEENSFSAFSIPFPFQRYHPKLAIYTFLCDSLLEVGMELKELCTSIRFHWSPIYRYFQCQRTTYQFPINSHTTQLLYYVFLSSFLLFIIFAKRNVGRKTLKIQVFDLNMSFFPTHKHSAAVLKDGLMGTQCQFSLPSITSFMTQSWSEHKQQGVGLGFRDSRSQ